MKQLEMGLSVEEDQPEFNQVNRSLSSRSKHLNIQPKAKVLNAPDLTFSLSPVEPPTFTTRSKNLVKKKMDCSIDEELRGPLETSQKRNVHLGLNLKSEKRHNAHRWSDAGSPNLTKALVRKKLQVSHHSDELDAIDLAYDSAFDSENDIFQGNCVSKSNTITDSRVEHGIVEQNFSNNETEASSTTPKNTQRARKASYNETTQSKIGKIFHLLENHKRNRIKNDRKRPSVVSSQSLMDFSETADYLELENDTTCTSPILQEINSKSFPTLDGLSRVIKRRSSSLSQFSVSAPVAPEISSTVTAPGPPVMPYTDKTTGDKPDSRNIPLSGLHIHNDSSEIQQNTTRASRHKDSQTDSSLKTKSVTEKSRINMVKVPSLPTCFVARAHVARLWCDDSHTNESQSQRYNRHGIRQSRESIRVRGGTASAWLSD